MVLIHRWSLYAGSIAWDVYNWGPVKCGLYKQVVLIYRWALQQVWRTIICIFTLSDWNATEYRYHGDIPLPADSYKLVLPLVLRYLTPTPVAMIGLGAVSAAVMSSCDSSCLAVGVLFGESVYSPLRNKLACKYGYKQVLIHKRHRVWMYKF